MTDHSDDDVARSKVVKPMMKKEKKKETPQKRLTTETVESTALTLECVDDIERSNSLALGVLSVGNSIANDSLEEGLENTASLLVDH